MSKKSDPSKALSQQALSPKTKNGCQDGVVSEKDYKAKQFLNCIDSLGAVSDIINSDLMGEVNYGIQLCELNHYVKPLSTKHSIQNI